MKDLYDMGESQARSGQEIRLPESLTQDQAVEFVMGYADQKAGGLAGNKAGLYAEYAPRFGLPKEPFLDVLSDRPESRDYLARIWPDGSDGD